MKKILKNKVKYLDCCLKRYKHFSEFNNILIYNKIDYFLKKNYYKKFSNINIKSKLF